MKTSRVTCVVFLALLCAAVFAGPYTRFSTTWTSGAARTVTVGDEVEVVGIEVWNVPAQQTNVTVDALWQSADTNLYVYVRRSDFAGASNIMATVYAGLGPVEGAEVPVLSGAETVVVSRTSGTWFPAAGERWYVTAQDALVVSGQTNGTVVFHAIGR